MSRGVITCLQKKANHKQSKKKTTVQAKKSTRDMRVLTSKEGCQEMQQLHEEAQQKETHQNEEQAQKAANDQAQHKCRADLSHTFTGPLNKSRHNIRKS